MKLRRWLFLFSVLLNVLLGAWLWSREVEFRSQRFLLSTDASNWAHFAGKVQCQIDFGDGFRRVLHLTPTTSDNDHNHFSGAYEGKAEIWNWFYDANSPQPIQASFQSYTEGYNQRMQSFLAHEPSGKPAQNPATSPAAAPAS